MGVPSQQESDLSPQTRWMLSIRDARDRDAFAMLFDFFAPRVKAMAMRGGANTAQAEEIVQDAMLQVWRRAGQFDPSRAQVSAWIYAIARNRQIDLIRREARPVPEILAIENPADEDPGMVLGLQQEAAELRAALARLPSSQREMVEKTYLGELSHGEISRQTGLPLGTVKSRVRLALQRLRHELRGLK